MKTILIKKLQHEVAPDPDLLDTAELLRYRRLASPLKQREFLTGRTLLKSVIADHLKLPPKSVSLSLTANGKPFLPGSTTFHFNLSHSDGHYLVGLSAHPVGVDVEVVRGISIHLFRPFLADAEFRILLNQAEPGRSILFYRLFTMKEAFLKATDKQWPVEEIEFCLSDQTWELRYPGGPFRFLQWESSACCAAVCFQTKD